MSPRVLRLVIVCLTAWLLADSARAQTADDLFNPDVLHRIDLLVNSLDWEKLKANFQENQYYPVDVRWNGLTVHNAGMRSRGSGSRSGTKPGLRIDFNRYTTNGSFLGLKSFVLDNLRQDPTGIKERLAMRLYERMGLPAPREVHAGLYVNNEYVGVYVVVESIDRDFLRRVFGDINGDVQNDGYLFEYDYTMEWFFNYLGSDLEPYAALFDPKTHETASMSNLYSTIEAMFRAINESPDAMFEAAVSPYLDLPLFLRHVAVQGVLAQHDGILGYAGVNNFYLYRFEGTDRHQLIAWDEDNAFHAIDYSVIEGHDQNVLMRRAMAVPALRATYFAALLEAAASTMAKDGPGPDAAGWLEREILQQRQLITGAMYSDPVKAYTNEEFDGAMDELILFARERDRQVRCEVARLTEPEAVAIACPALP